jgi:hypothetical protein
MTPVTFLGESVLPLLKPNTFKMLLKYHQGDEYSTNSRVALVLKLLFVLFQSHFCNNMRVMQNYGNLLVRLHAIYIHI